MELCRHAIGKLVVSHIAHFLRLHASMDICVSLAYSLDLLKSIKTTFSLLEAQLEPSRGQQPNFFVTPLSSASTLNVIAVRQAF